MRIPLEIVDENILLTCTIHAPRIVGRITFIVDTGSPISFIGAIDAQKLQIPKKVEKDNKIFWADKEFKLGRIRNVDLWTLGIESGKERLKILKTPSLNVTFDFIHEKEKMDSPNILGLDFIMNQKLKLIIDGKNREAYFGMNEK